MSEWIRKINWKYVVVMLIGNIILGLGIAIFKLSGLGNDPFSGMVMALAEWNNRDHRKITVIDGKVGFTGGYNLANEYFNFTHPYGQWKDTGIRLEGEAVRSLTVTFLEMWNAVSDKDKNDSDFTGFLVHTDYQAKQAGFIQPYADSPMDHEQVGEEVYISMVNKAEKYCWFMTPYLIITDEMSHALCLAAKRGVDVRIYHLLLYFYISHQR